MSFTNSQLAQKISDLIDYWSNFNKEYSDWQGGAVDGGPSSDGRYPLTDWYGNELLVKSPAKLQDDVDNITTGATAQANAAAASAAAAAASESNASTSAATATAQAVLADADRVAAELAETNAADSAVTATAQANLATARVGYAEEWANAAYQTLVSVAAGGNGVDEYSAKHWAQVAENFAGSVDSGLYGQLAQAETVTTYWTFSAQATGAGSTYRGAIHIDSGVNNDNRITGKNGGYIEMYNAAGGISIQPFGNKLYINPDAAGTVYFGGSALADIGGDIGITNNKITGNNGSYFQPYDGAQGDMWFVGSTAANTAIGDIKFQVGNPSATILELRRVDATIYAYGPLESTGNINTSGNVTGANLNVSNWDTAYGWGNHASAGYLTSETSHADVVVDGDFASNGILKRTAAGVYGIVTDNSANWDTAYGWGDHASAGYATVASGTFDGAVTAGNDTNTRGEVLIYSDNLTSPLNDDALAPGRLWMEGRGAYADWNIQPWQNFLYFYTDGNTIGTPSMTLAANGAVVFNSTGTFGGSVSLGGPLLLNAHDIEPGTTYLDVKSTNATYNGLRLYNSSGTLQGYVGYTDGTYIGFLNGSGAWVGRWTLSNGAQVLSGTLDGNGQVASSFTDYRVTAANGNGIGFWNGNPETYGIYMSAAGDATYGGRVTGETTSDYNMYFEMNSGTNRGFVFETDTAKLFSINPNGVYTSVPMTIAAGANGRLEVTGSGYAVNPTGIAIGQYTSTIGYIQAPTGGDIAVWDDGTVELARFKNDGTVQFRVGTVDFGESSNTQGGLLRIHGTTALKTSTIQCTNGNLHIDAETGSSTYINWYEGSNVYMCGSAGTANARVHSAGIYVTGTDTNPGALYSALSSNMLHIDGKEAIDGNDSWMRLNQNADFASGIYTPGFVRIDGGLQVGGTTTAGFYIDSGEAAIKWKGGGVAYHGSTSYASHKVTFSTSAASGGSSGDIWYQYT